jgi:hypothetical protein
MLILDSLSATPTFDRAFHFPCAGRDMTPSYQRRINAIHEAAHAVVGWQMQIESLYSTIDPGLNGPRTEVVSVAAPRDRITMLYAGDIAARLAFGDGAVAPHQRDYDEIERLVIEHAVTDKILNEIWEHAVGLVDWHWGIIREVADELVTHGTIEGLVAWSIWHDNCGKGSGYMFSYDGPPPPGLKSPVAVRDRRPPKLRRPDRQTDLP